MDKAGDKTAPVLRYPPSTLLGDYIRSATGVGVGLGVLAVNPLTWTLGLICGGVLGTFGYLGLRALQRQATRIAVTPEGLVHQAATVRHHPWSGLRAVRLRHYGMRRESGDMKGFSQLTLTTTSGRLTVESNIEGFDYLVYEVGAAARAHGVRLDPRSAGHMLDLGIDPDGETPPPERVRAWLG